MSNVFNAHTQKVPLATNKARGGVTGHHVRYVLGFGLAGIMPLSLSWASWMASAPN